MISFIAASNTMHIQTKKNQANVVNTAADLLMHQVVELDWHYPSLPLAQDNDEDSRTEGETEVDVLVAEPEIAKPPMYAVIMYNDNYTPMDFVVYVLQSEFRHNIDDAVQIMLNIHNSGKGIAGIYPKDIAETKAKKVNSLAQREGYPLLTQIEPHQGE